MVKSKYRVMIWSNRKWNIRYFDSYESARKFYLKCCKIKNKVIQEIYIQQM
jgi:hypothetical protein